MRNAILGPSKFAHRIPQVILGMDLVLVLALFAAPLTVPHGTVRDLDARANAMDHWDRWKEMDLFPMIVYTFGDFNCHQRESRSLILNGNEIPVCARDIAIFTGILIGAFLLIRARASDNPSEIFLSILPKWFRTGVLASRPGITFAIIFFLMCIPTALDGGVQMLSGMPIWPFEWTYESTNPTRILTGMPLGIAVGILGTSLVMTLLSRRDDNGEPLLLSFRKAV